MPHDESFSSRSIIGGIFRRLPVALLLGAGTTIAVAWGLALLNSERLTPAPLRQGGFDVNGAAHPLTPVMHNGADLVEAMRADRWGTRIVRVRPVINGTPYGCVESLLEGTAATSDYSIAIANGEPPLFWWRADGWPCLALSTSVRWPHGSEDSVPEIRTGIPTESAEPSVFEGFPILPLQPLWLGFLANTSVFALLWLACPLLLRIRPALRRRRGCCARCGYPRQHGQLRCSECGDPYSP